VRLLVGCLLIAAAVAATQDPVSDWAESKGGKFIRDASGRITAAEFRASWITDSDLERLAAMPDLEHIDLSHTRITDIGFEHLRKLERVQTVNLYFAEQIGDGALAAMKNWKQLRELSLHGTKVTDAGLTQLANHAALESLDIGYALITDGGFDALTTLPNLKSLAIGGNKISDVGLNLLRQIPTLTALDVSGAQRTDSGLWSASMTDVSLDVIGSLTRLEQLNVRGTKISDAGMGKLAGLTNLQSFNAAETQLSAKGLAVLAKFPKLRELNLWNATRVTDDVIPLIAALPSLKWVDLTGTKVSPGGLEKLHIAHP
jgi:Leucine-rich repeat (LRR) protein